MTPKSAGRFAAVAGAALLVVGGVSLWLSADGQGAGAATAASAKLPAQAAVAPEDATLTIEPARPKSREEQRFARADKDDDGRITQAEYLQQRRRNFDKLDVNGDGGLGFEEYAASGIAKFRTADADGNGALAAAEFAKTAPKPKNRQTASVEGCRCPPTGAVASSNGDLPD
jgi:hypothetical protein